MITDDLQGAVLEVLGCPHALKLGGWVKMDRLLQGLAVRHGIRPKSETEKAREALERNIREAMSQGGRVISTHSNGYKLTRLATKDELEHAVAELRSRVNATLERVDATRGCWIEHHDPATHQPRETLC